MNYLKLVPPPIADLEAYRQRRDAQHRADLDVAAFDLARLTREVHEEMERTEDFGDAA